MESPLKKIKHRWHTLPIVVSIYALFSYWGILKPTWSLSWIEPAKYIFIVPLILYFTAFGRVRLGEGSIKNNGWFSWLIKMLLAALTYIFIVTSVQYAVVGNGPYMAQIHISMPLYWEEVSLFQKEKFNDYILWGMVFTWVIATAYFTYVKNGVPCTHRIAAQLFPAKGKWVIRTKAYIEVNIYLISMLAVNLAWAASVILIGTGLMRLANIPSYMTIPVLVTAVFSIGFLYFGLPASQKHFRLLARYGLSLNSLSIIAVLIIMGLFIGSGMLSSVFFKKMPELISLRECDCMPGILQLFPEARMQGLHVGIYMLSMPLLVSYMAKISRGRCVRDLVLVGVVFLPVFFMILKWMMVLIAGENWAGIIIDKTLLPESQIIIGAVLAILMIAIQWRRKSAWLFSNGFMERPEKYNMSEVSLYDGTKIKGIAFTGRKYMIGLMAIILVHCSGGWYLIGMQVLVLTPVILYLYYGGLIAFIFALYQEGFLKKISNYIPFVKRAG